MWVLYVVMGIVVGSRNRTWRRGFGGSFAVVVVVGRGGGGAEGIWVLRRCVVVVVGGSCRQLLVGILLRTCHSPFNAPLVHQRTHLGGCGVRQNVTLKTSLM